MYSKIRCIVLLLLIANATISMAQKYITGDFHQHTTYTDGSYSMGYMMSKNNEFGLEWWANSEHGGASTRDASLSGLEAGNGKIVYWDETQPNIIIGTERFNNGRRVMRRWQVLRDFSFAQILKARTTYPNKTIIQSYEMNVPGYEHASMGIIDNQFVSNPNCNPLAEFEYKFDQNDTDTIGGKAQGWEKSKLSGHDKTMEAINWLRVNYPRSSYLVIAHPERKPQDARGYTIAAIRQFNNAAPDICFGFESVPGHQRENKRGGYDHNSVGGGTYGGSGIFSAKIGGLWDALLSEGRKFWLFSNSDYHSEKGDFYPGEYQKNYTFTKSKSAQDIVDGLRSGNTWVVNGDLIDSLIFTVKNSSGKHQMMGGTLEVKAGSSVDITIKARNPQQNNNTFSDYRKPKLSHIDLIQGTVSEKISPNSADFKTDTVSTTAVIARFDAKGGYTDTNGLKSNKWKDMGNGWIEIKYSLKNIKNDMYFRLRGTNHAPNTPNETDGAGNPLIDNLVGENNAAKAFADLWFYSNPIFIAKKVSH